MDLSNLIGNTPMIKIIYKYKGNIQSLYTKLEYYNFTGSIKDRVAYRIIKIAKANNILKDNQPIIEVTSGNTGISFSALGAFYNHPIHIFMPDWVSIERRTIMEIYGAKLHLISRELGGFQGALKLADDFSKEINGFRPDQFNNYENILAHYNTTGLEILSQFPDVDSFVSGIGTGGTLIGIAKRLKEHNPNINIYALEPSTLAILSTGNSIGTHKIEGIGDDFIPGIVDKKFIDDIVLINDDDAINMSRLLSKKLGIGVGISSGANFLASVLKNVNNKIVTVFPDDNKKYLSTALSLPIDENPNFISNQIELIGLE